MGKLRAPDFLQAFACDLKNYERPFISIKTEFLEVDPLVDPLGLLSSKFLGLPFFPKGKDYPTDREGDPMILVVQINFKEIPSLKPFPDSGILQLFFSKARWYANEVAIVFHDEKDVLEEPMQNFSFLKSEDYEQIPIHKVHRLSFAKEMEPGEPEDSQFDCSFGGLSYWDYYEKLGKNQATLMDRYFNGDGHKIGGYSFFTQGDPRAYEADRKDDIQLLQIDSDEAILFGDMGLIHLFIDPVALQAGDFSKAYFYWDCF